MLNLLSRSKGYFYSMKYTLTYIFASILLFSCGNKEAKKIGSEAEITTSTEINSVERETPEVAISDALPVFNFEQLEAKYLKPSDATTTYVINFWATWCKPCVKELPYFEQIRTDYKDKNVKVVLVSLDFPEQIEKQVVPFIEKHQLQSEIVLLDDPDANSWISKVSKDWTGAIPATIIIKGDAQQFYEKSFTYNELETEIKSIL